MSADRWRFVWSRPRLVVYRPAHLGFRIALNQLCGVRIGVYAVVGARCFSLVWGNARKEQGVDR